MCWVYELAKAVRKVREAQEHVKRAELAMRRRAERFKRRRTFWMAGASDLELIRISLGMTEQSLLKAIELYGIKIVKEGSRTLRKLMEPRLRVSAEEWVNG
jgi:hypothetical protein